MSSGGPQKKNSETLSSAQPSASSLSRRSRRCTGPWPGSPPSARAGWLPRFRSAAPDAPGVGADRGDLLFLAPVAVLEFRAARVAAGIAAPFLLGQAAFDLAGAHDDEIAFADFDIGVFSAFIEFVVGNALAILHPLNAAMARDVEQHAAPDHLVPRMLDAEHREAARVDQLGVVAVIGLVLVEDVAERVPMRSALHAHISVSSA